MLPKSNMVESIMNVVETLPPEKQREVVVSERAFVHPQAQLGEKVTIMPMAYVGQATIGANSIVFPFEKTA